MKIFLLLFCALLLLFSVVEELQVQILKLLLNNKDKSTVGDHREVGCWRSRGLLTPCVCFFFVFFLGRGVSLHLPQQVPQVFAGEC